MFQRGKRLLGPERRERWALLTVETEANGDSKRTNERCPLGWFVGFVVPVQEIFVMPWLHDVVGPVQNIFFLTVHYFSALVPAAKQAGQAAVLARLSLSVCVSGQHYLET